MAELFGFDITPEIVYRDGIAVQLRRYAVFNRAYRAMSLFELRPDGSITEWHEDPEHGDWPSPQKMTAERLRDLAKYNRGSLDVREVLGKSEEKVGEKLKRKRISVRSLSYQETVQPILDVKTVISDTRIKQ